MSVRTLHYYDQLGLLRPAAVSAESGYRWYDDAEVCRLQQILFYRELDFPLREIAVILSSPEYDAQEALRRQRELLALKRRRLDRLLDLLDANLKGERIMDFSGFSTQELEEARSAYAAEAERRWGNTEAWRISRERLAGSTKEDREAFRKQSNKIFRRFAALRNGNPASPEAQAAVADWQSFLNERCYPCGRELLAGLGAMYTGDERFRNNLNRFGEGTAEFMSAAIAAFCKG